ncbi:MAG: lipid-binding SYLF domain-containing protein, partial [Candidatus Acidiferrum sp.]
MSRLIALTLFAVTLSVGSAGAQALQRRQRADNVVVDGKEVLSDIAQVPEKGIPPALLREAAGVVILPGVINGGFIIGGRFGRGVLLARDSRGGWSFPVFITLVGGSVGWQAGAQSTDLILVFRNKRGVARLIEGRDKLTLGVDAAIAAGPVGREGGAATDVLLKAEVFSYARSRG